MNSKFIVIAGSGFSFALEPYEKSIFVHCDVIENPKPSVIKEMFRRWKSFKEAITIDLYALHSDKKNVVTHKHFLKMFGFTYQQTFKGRDGDMVELWINKGK